MYARTRYAHASRTIENPELLMAECKLSLCILRFSYPHAGIVESHVTRLRADPVRLRIDQERREDAHHHTALLHGNDRIARPLVRNLINENVRILRRRIESGRYLQFQRPYRCKQIT